MTDYTLMSIKQAHEFCGLPIKALYRLAERGEIEIRRDGRTIYIRKRSLVEWIDGKEQPWQNEAGGDKVRSFSARRISSGSRG